MFWRVVLLVLWSLCLDGNVLIFHVVSGEFSYCGIELCFGLPSYVTSHGCYKRVSLTDMQGKWRALLFS